MPVAALPIESKPGPGSFQRHGKLLALLCLLSAYALHSRPAQAQEPGSGLKILAGHVLPRTMTGPPREAFDGGASLNLMLGLTPPNPLAIQERLRALYEPGNPLYRHFLKPDQFGAQFGVAAAQYQAVLDFARKNGLTVRRLYKNRLMVAVSCEVSDVPRVFHTTLRNFQRPDGSSFYAPDNEPSVDAGLPLSHISGLDDFSQPKPGYGTGPRCTGGDSYIGSDFRSAYLPCCANLNGSGQTIALVEFDNYYDADINSYATDEGQSLPTVTRKFVDETAAQTPACGDIEASMDIELLTAMAPAASILVYEAPHTGATCNMTNAPTDVLAAIADDDSAQEISNSWLWFGWPDTTATAIFQQYAMQGQSFFTCAGDLGAYGPAGPETVPWEPASDTSMMTVVGGTQLNTTGPSGVPLSSGTYVSETTWNQSPGPAATQTPPVNAVGGGGVCDGANPLAIPTWQVPFVNAQNNASAVDRNIPDVAMTAENVFIVASNGSKECASGTSAATPLWAGLAALVNQEAAQLGQSPVGFLNTALYNLAISPTSYAADFHDINDSSTNSYWGNALTQYSAVTGYDLCTGLGSPKCNLVWDLLGVSPTFTASPSSTQTSTATVSPSATPTPSRSSTPTYSASPSATLSPTPSMSASPTATDSPTVSPTPSATVSSTDSPSSSPTLSSTASPSFTVSATGSPTSTFSPSPTASPTCTLSPSASPTSTYSPSPTASPTCTLSSSASPSCTLSASASPTSTYSPSSTASPAQSGSPSPSPSYTSSANPSMTATPSDSPGPSPRSSPTPSPSASLPPTESPEPAPSTRSTAGTAPSGANQILQAVPVPNPNASALALYLAGGADTILVKVYSKAFVLVRVFEIEGVFAPGWTRAALPGQWERDLTNGVYFVVVRPERQGRQGLGPRPIKLAVLR